MKYTVIYGFYDGSSTIAHVECRNERKLRKLLIKQFKDNDSIQYADVEWMIEGYVYAYIARINGTVIFDKYRPLKSPEYD